MKIEMALPTLELGGMEQMVVALSVALAKNGHDVGVTCLGAAGPLSEPLERASIPIHVVRAPTVLSNIFAPALTRHFAVRAPDVLHTHSGVWGRAARAARLAGVKRAVHTVHGKLDQDPWYDVPLKRWESTLSDVVVAVSDALATDLTDRIGIPRSRVQTLINGIDTCVFQSDAASRASTRSALGLADRFVVGVVARLVPIKNHQALVQAIARLRSSIPEIALVIVGDGPLESALREQVISLQLDETVQFLGARTDTADLYRAFDLFVLPSLAEGTSLSVLESMSSSVPVVATAVGGTPTLLENGQCGWLSKSVSAVDLSLAVMSAYTNYDQSIQQAKRARLRACERYSLSAMVSEYEALYAPSSLTERT